MRHGTTLGLISILWSGAAFGQSVAVRCGPDGGELIGASAGLVSIGETVYLITERPEGVALGEADVAMTPDQFCDAVGFILPVPHPGDPMSPPVAAETPRPRIGDAHAGRIIAAPTATSTAEAARRTGSESDDGAEPGDQNDHDEGATVLFAATAVEEPTPSPAAPPPLRRLNRDHPDCSAAAARPVAPAGAVSLLLLLAGSALQAARRRRP